MAHWGIALMSLGNLFAWPANPAAIKAAATSAGAAQSVGARTQRERDYISALQALFLNWETTEHWPRVVAFEKAMGEVVTRYSEDDEAKILHALLLDATALPADKTYANQLKAAALLEPLLSKYPDHPGVAHYLIHTYDYTELAGKGLPAARLYANIAPWCLMRYTCHPIFFRGWGPGRKWSRAIGLLTRQPRTSCQRRH
jgi:hypothetical protein